MALSGRERSRRRDGGDVTGRIRIVLEVVDAVRAAVGADVPVGIQVNGVDGIPGGLTLSESIEICQRLDATGALDYMTIKSGSWTRKELIGPDMQAAHGLWVEAAAAIRKAVEKRCRVFTVGRIVDSSSGRGYPRVREGRHGRHDTGADG